jgi:hypothetical protein
MALGVLFLVAGGSKLFSPDPLTRTLRTILRLSWTSRIIELVARGLGVVEIVCAVCVSAIPKLGAPTAFALGAGIAVFSLIAVTGDHSISCGCFGRSGGRPLGVRNLLAGAGIMAGAGLLVILVAEGELTENRWPETMALVALATIVYVTANDASTIAPLLRRPRSAE